jgi:SAM-dependent methyltransferase
VILKATGMFERPGHAVDMGCGGGRWSKLLADAGWSVTCADVNAEALAICRRNVPAATSILADPTGHAIPSPSDCASLLLCIEVVPLIEARWFLNEVHRVLEPDGLFVGVHINGRSWRALAWRLKHLISSDEGRFYNEAYSDWRDRLVATGFEMVHEESCCWGPFSRDSNSPFVPAFARAERALRLHRVITWSPWVVFIARKKGSSAGPLESATNGFGGAAA